MDLGIDPTAAGSAIAVAAAAAGLGGSLHCFAMCGPLACAGCSRANASTREKRGSVALYQLGRVGSYALVGAALGGLGREAAENLAVSTSGWLPWATAALLVAAALGVFERLPAIPFLAQLLRPSLRKSAGWALPLRGLALGLVTPLIPCGLLYAVWLASAMTGSVAGGATLAAAFALGGVPALLLAQLQTAWIERLPRFATVVVRRVVPLVAAAVVVWRALSGPDCPACVG